MRTPVRRAAYLRKEHSDFYTQCKFDLHWV